MAAATGHYDWEPVASNAKGYDTVERMRVPGGWLYRNAILADDAHGLVSTLVFVPATAAERQRREYAAEQTERAKYENPNE